MKKGVGDKGQITVFIVVGLILLGTVGLITYFYTSFNKYSSVPTAFKPVVTYVDGCVGRLTLDGIFLLSMQGGYVTLPEKIQADPNAYVDTGFKVPHWFYEGERRGPFVQTVERDLADYITRNLPLCLNNFTSLRDSYDLPETITAEDITTSVLITPENVHVETELPITIRNRGESSEITLPTITVDTKIPLGEMLDFAYALMNTEDTKYFLEYYTDEIIASSDYLPYEGMDFGCNAKVWTQKEIKEHIQTILMYNLHYLHFENTEYSETEYEYFNEIFKVKVTDGDFSSIHAEVIYDPQWDMDLTVQPTTDGKITSIRALKSALYVPCINLYHHKYSLNYPVVIKLTHKDAPELPFYFATPVLTKRNLPNRWNEVEPWPEEVDTLASKAFCAKETEVTEYKTSPQGYIYTDERTQQTWPHQIEVFAFDVLYPELPLANVNISYRCVSFECQIGQTSLPLTNGVYTGGMASLKATFPTCVNGYVLAEAQGYEPTKIQQTIDETTANTILNIPMVQLRKLNLTVTVVQEHNGMITKRALDETEQAVVLISHGKKSSENDQFIITTTNGSNEQIKLVANETTYALTIQLTDDQEFLGYFAMNWTPQAIDVLTQDHVTMYVIKKDITLVTPQDYQKIFDYAMQESPNYPPEIR